MLQILSKIAAASTLKIKIYFILFNLILKQFLLDQNKKALIV